jgi:homospermidine synthase
MHRSWRDFLRPSWSGVLANGVGWWVEGRTAGIRDTDAVTEVTLLNFYRAYVGRARGAAAPRGVADTEWARLSSVLSRFSSPPRA